MVSASELVLMDPDELVGRLAESRKELFNLRFQLATGQLDNSARMGQVRRDVARILTVLRERDIQEAEGADVDTGADRPRAGAIGPEPAEPVAGDLAAGGGQPTRSASGASGTDADEIDQEEDA